MGDIVAPCMGPPSGGCMDAGHQKEGKSMDFVNLNNTNIEVNYLKSGRYDYMVKTGRVKRHIRISKDVGTTWIEMFSKSGHILYSIPFASWRMTSLTRAMVEELDAASEIMESIRRLKALDVHGMKWA